MCTFKNERTNKTKSCTSRETIRDKQTNHVDTTNLSAACVGNHESITRHGTEGKQGRRASHVCNPQGNHMATWARCEQHRRTTRNNSSAEQTCDRRMAGHGQAESTKHTGARLPLYDKRENANESRKRRVLVWEWSDAHACIAHQKWGSDTTPRLSPRSRTHKARHTQLLCLPTIT